MWSTATNAPLPAWIRYDFDDVYKLQEMWVWNYNSDYEYLLGAGMKNVTVEYSTDGTTWTTLGNYEFAQAPAAGGYAHDATISFGGVAAKSVRITVTSNYGGAASGLSEVRFYSIPTQARQPQPATGTRDVGLDPTLTWWAGREAVSHQVYLGTDANALTLAGYGRRRQLHGAPGISERPTTGESTRSTRPRPSPPGPATSGASRRSVPSSSMTWKATTTRTRAVFDTWVDGYDNPTTNGAQVGYGQSAGGTFNETTTTHGGKQSMPLTYNNTNVTMTSEAVRTFDTAAGLDPSTASAACRCTSTARPPIPRPFRSGSS